MKISELEGSELDYWVAKAEGLEPKILLHGDLKVCHIVGEQDEEVTRWDWYCPSSHWNKGGPIMDKEKIGTEHCPQVDPDHPWIGWIGSSDDFPADQKFYPSDTSLIAAMRARVASKYGETVPDDA